MSSSTLLDAPVIAPQFRGWTNAANLLETARTLHRQYAPKLADAVRHLAGYDSPDDIAEFFRREGVRGRTGSAGHCPAAVWLTAQVGHQVRVGPTLSMYYDGGSTVLEAVPPVIRDFYRAFDKDAYRFLVQPCGCHNCRTLAA